MSDQTHDLVGGEAERHWPHHALHNAEVVELGHRSDVTGVPLAEDSALIDAGLDFNLGPAMTLGVSYSGQIASDLTDNAVRGRFTWLF